ncbi:hypothetical protein AVEN_225279-1 [Araneus ventricosus]|uniref:Uncharacterized protein n=1 Tax=Araneus ventricosus TaxID=182803 RepID=A0A4Y2AMZ2_ARAVE|nr:hypothetical protein AVEN_225279-1 [Araneus ventricosus]
MNVVSIPGSEEFEVLSPSCIEIVQCRNFNINATVYSRAQNPWGSLSVKWVYVEVLTLLPEGDMIDLTSALASEQTS